MKNKILIISAIILSAFLFYAYLSSREEKSYKSIEDIIKSEIEKHRKIEKELFDSLFNDKFFSKDYNPFEEIENFKKRIMRILNDDKFFLRSFEDWEKLRISNEGIDIKTYETEKEYVYEINIEKPENKNLSIEVRNDYIKVYNDTKNIKEEEKDNTIRKSFSSINITKYISLPPETRGKEHSVEKNENKIIIRFKK